MNKIVFLKIQTPSHWKSCQLLLEELEKCYRLAYGDNLKVVAIRGEQQSLDEDLTSILSENPDRVVFADHRLRTSLWMKAIKEKYQGKLSWGIHAYGCFSGRTDEWLQLEQIAGSDPVLFLAGSENHAKLMKVFFQDAASVGTFPFPYDEGQAVFIPKLRIESRAKFGLGETEIALVYAGRISFQKNVHHLIRLLGQLKPKSQKLRLFICGSVDENNPRRIPHGYYLNYSTELFYLALTEAKQAGLSVEYLGEQSHEELVKLYHACDYAVSLSTLYGEDYGRSLIEAMSNGVGIIATDWGGHQDFNQLPQAKLIPVILENETLKIDTEELETVLHKLNFVNRDKNIEHFKKTYGTRLKSASLEALYSLASTLKMSGEAVKFNLRDNRPWKQKEFFNIHEKVLRTYWERSRG